MGEHGDTPSDRQGEQQSNFPDQKAPERANCYGYVFYKLGLDPDETTAGLQPSMVEDLFETADSQEKADTLALKSRRIGEYRHMVWVDRKRGKLIHKGNVKWPIEETSLPQLNVNYPPDQFEYQWLKHKHKGKLILNLLRRLRRSP